MITPEQIRLVQQSFVQVVPITDKVAQVFYDKLFELDPSVRHLFKTDMHTQRVKMMQMLVIAVSGLSRPDVLLPAVQELGQRHTNYGVTPEHYQTVGKALLYALETKLESAFTPEVKDAWVAAYTMLTEVALAAAVA